MAKMVTMTPATNMAHVLGTVAPEAMTIATRNANAHTIHSGFIGLISYMLECFRAPKSICITALQG